MGSQKSKWHQWSNPHINLYFNRSIPTSKTCLSNRFKYRKKEKDNPKIISGSRRKRIAQGSGVDVSKINKLLKQFRMMSDMMKKVSKGKKIPSGAIPDEILNQLKWKEKNVKNKTINGRS